MSGRSKRNSRSFATRKPIASPARRLIRGPLFQETMNSMKPKLEYRRNEADRLKKEIDQVFREWEDAERDLLRPVACPDRAVPAW